MAQTASITCIDAQLAQCWWPPTRGFASHFRMSFLHHGGTAADWRGDALGGDWYCRGGEMGLADYLICPAVEAI